MESTSVFGDAGMGVVVATLSLISRAFPDLMRWCLGPPWTHDADLRLILHLDPAPLRLQAYSCDARPAQSRYTRTQTHSETQR